MITEKETKILRLEFTKILELCECFEGDEENMGKIL